MSLTSNLDRGDSDIRQFFAKHLPKLRTVARRLNVQFAGAELRASSSQLSPYEKTVAGGAIDHRMRLMFNSTYTSEVITFGANIMGRPWSRTGGIYEKLLAYRSKTRDEKRLCQISIVFAYLDGCFRSGMESETLMNIGSTKIGQMLDALNPALVQDVMTQSLIVQQHPFIRSIASTNNLVLGPSFEGSLDVGGADADLIADGLLIDCKSTMKCKLKSTIFRQLIGYWLLDYSDYYAVNKVGVYFARHGEFWTIDIAELLSMCGFESEKGLRDLWDEDRRRRTEQARIIRGPLPQPQSKTWQRPQPTKEEAREMTAIGREAAMAVRRRHGDSGEPREAEKVAACDRQEVCVGQDQLRLDGRS